MGKKVGWALVGALVLMAVVGCTTKSKVTEEDRVVLDHSVQIAQIQGRKLELLAAVITNDPARAAAAVKDLEVLVADARANAEQLQKNWGPPKEPVPYTPENAELARKASDKSHSVGFWASLGGIFLAGGGIALGIARSPLARLIPGFGPVFSALDTTVTAVETFMQKNKAEGKVDVVAQLRDTLQKAHEDANLRPYIDKFLAKAQDKLGVPVSEILAPTPTPTVAAVPATPPPS